MKSKQMTLPKQKVWDYAYGLAHQIAREQLAKIDDIEQQCLKSGARYADSRKVTIEYLNQSYLISIPDAEVTLATSEESVPIRDKLLILHYFTQAKGTPLSNKKITYKELPDGINYYPTFSKRAIEPLVSFFGGEPHRLLDIAAGNFGGYQADYGDTSVTIDAFSLMPITLILWKGDEEFAPEGNIMFDSTISDYLPTEDIAVLCENIAWRLVKLLKTEGDNPGKRHVNQS
ncbi:DUF3786 domain-containing protein [Chloroflexota bacterium]